jgi:hypothetical protein
MIFITKINPVSLWLRKAIEVISEQKSGKKMEEQATVEPQA